VFNAMAGAHVVEDADADRRSFAAVNETIGELGPVVSQKVRDLIGSLSMAMARSRMVAAVASSLSASGTCSKTERTDKTLSK
jgi:hypothetical protein